MNTVYLSNRDNFKKIKPKQLTLIIVYSVISFIEWQYVYMYSVDHSVVIQKIKLHYVHVNIYIIKKGKLMIIFHWIFIYNTISMFYLFWDYFRKIIFNCVLCSIIFLTNLIK